MVTGFIGSSANGLYTAASKIPNFIIMFSSIFIDAWQLSAVDEYDSEGKAEFFTKIFRTYSAGVFTVSSGLILVCQFVTKILVANSYYESWKYVPILIIATTMSCFVSFLGSVYMAEKESVMAMVTAVTGAVANIGLNLILIPKLGAIETSLGGVGAAASTVVAFVIIFVTRTFNTKKYVKINFKAPLIILQTLLLIAQCVVMLILQSGLKMYAIELGLFIVMAILNSKSLIELLNALITKFLKKGRKNNA
jgi:O-antigen/teichoic acid export membrane protein